jgi:hypothetical protein
MEKFISMKNFTALDLGNTQQTKQHLPSGIGTSGRWDYYQFT